MPLLNRYACKKRLEYTMKYVPKDARILEVGSGKGWFSEYCKENGWTNYTGMDIEEESDITGDILNWKKLGIKERSFDRIVAFELVEHVHCFKELSELLTDDGLLILTSPAHHFDVFCKILENLGLNQKRTSPHDHLISFKKIPFFEAIELKRIGFLIQWGVFKKSEH